MRTSGEIRIFAKKFIEQITRKEIVQREDIRWIKDRNGQFPLKFVWDGLPGDVNSTFKETPFSPNDTFVLFDVIEEKNMASEVIGSGVRSTLPFRIVINIYGNDSPNEVQYLLASLHKFVVRNWLAANKAMITEEPTNFDILDGRENAQWWIRRRVEIRMNMVQEITWEEESDVLPIEKLENNNKRVGE